MEQQSYKMIIITAPSGSGKTTLVKRLLQACPFLEFSISACTRTPRPGEQHAKDYYFYSPEDFKKLIEQDAFIEWEMVYTGKYYGTLKNELQRIWHHDRSPLVDIDVQGALAVQEKYRGSSLSIFIEAPSIDELRQRLLRRGTENPETLEERIAKAEYELSFASRFDTILINDNLDEATAQLIQLVTNFIEA